VWWGFACVCLVLAPCRIGSIASARRRLGRAASGEAKGCGGHGVCEGRGEPAGDRAQGEGGRRPTGTGSSAASTNGALGGIGIRTAAAGARITPGWNQRRHLLAVRPASP